MNTGRVVAGFGRHFLVEDEAGARVVCHPRGKKSECLVGDVVEWQPTQSGSMEGVIERLVPRRNLLFRQDAWKTKAFAANVDQMLLMVATEPVFSEAQLARALIAAQEARIPTRLVLNKCDLPSAAEARARLQPYIDMGITVMELSLRHEPAAAMEALQPWMQAKSTLVLGPSGTGKSTLINLLVPGAGVQVREISQALNSGKHTTTSTHWYWVDAAQHTALIDTPGFQAFGLRHIPSQQIPQLMPDFQAASTECRFYNCSHLHEPGCGVLKAVEEGRISPSRHRIYQDILQELAQTHW